MDTFTVWSICGVDGWEDRENHRSNTHLLFKLQSPLRVGAVEAKASLQ